MATQSFRSDGYRAADVESVSTNSGGSDNGDHETRRRVRLETSDRILDEIEELRLADRRHLPVHLRDRVRMLHLAVTGFRTNAELKTCAAAQDFIFGLQESLLGSNPRNHTERQRTTYRAPGQPVSVMTPTGGSWKILSLPAQPQGGLTDDWFAMAAAMLERAWERWAYAQHHATAAARRGSRQARRALACAVVAWGNYWQLLDEIDRLRQTREGDPR